MNMQAHHITLTGSQVYVTHEEVECIVLDGDDTFTGTLEDDTVTLDDPQPVDERKPRKWRNLYRTRHDNDGPLT